MDYNFPNQFDLFTPFGVQNLSYSAANGFRLTAVSIIPGKTNLIEATTNPPTWTPIGTNILPVNALSNFFNYSDPGAINAMNRFYRVKQLP